MRFSYPLTWPAHLKPVTPEHKRTYGRFGVRQSGGFKPISLYQAIARLDESVKKWTKTGKTYRIHPSDVVVSAQYPKLRVADGLPYSSQRPEGPAVCVYLTLDGIDIALPSDLYTDVEQNIAAVADYLDLKRGIERRGFADVATEFRGWAALPPADANAQAWAKTLEIEGQVTFDKAKTGYRRLAKAYHPNSPSGDRNKFGVIQQAYEQAQQYFGQ